MELRRVMLFLQHQIPWIEVFSEKSGGGRLTASCTGVEISNFRFVFAEITTYSFVSPYCLVFMAITKHVEGFSL